MQSSIPETVQPATTSKGLLWTARIISWFAALFIIMDGVMKVMNLPQVQEAMGPLGWPLEMSLTIGLIELVCIAIYLIPRTSFLGVVLMTAYLGGVVATQLRVGAPAFSLLFPIIIACMLWAAPYLLDSRVRALLPLREPAP